jgi:peptidoglycan biosynthesis protein MviN/MurJ (putative lipid II flippase)
LFWFLRKQGIYAPTGQWRRFLIQLVIAVAVMFVALLMLSAELGLLQSEVWQQGNWLQRIRGIGMVCTAGLLVYILVLFVLGFRPADLRGPAKATSRGH